MTRCRKPGAYSKLRMSSWASSSPDLIFGGPDTELKQTANTQPALLDDQRGVYEAFAAKGVQPDYVAGHSLGEYSALIAAGVLHFEDAVKLVRARGEFMEQAVPGGQGAMAAVLGGERDALAKLCADITAGGALVELANVNCPGQIVVSGSRGGVDAGCRTGEGNRSQTGDPAGSQRSVPLFVDEDGCGTARRTSWRGFVPRCQGAGGRERDRSPGSRPGRDPNCWSSGVFPGALGGQRELADSRRRGYLRRDRPGSV